MPRALIVDDDENTRSALAVLIEAEGFTIDLAKDLREARISLVRQTPDVVLTDLKLPEKYKDYNLGRAKAAITAVYNEIK